MRRTAVLLGIAVALCSRASAQELTPFFDGKYIVNASKLLRGCVEERSDTCKRILHDLVIRNEDMRKTCGRTSDEKDCMIAKGVQDFLSASFEALTPPREK